MTGACDTHMHFYDGSFPVAPEAVLRPPDASVADYQRVQARLATDRVVVVQPTTYGLDNTYYIGAADFVTRISRVHSVWFKTLDPFLEDEQLFEDPIYIEPIKEPRDEDQPDGTLVELSFRGASNIRVDRFLCGDLSVQNTQPLDNAQLLDSFGDYYDHTDYENSGTQIYTNKPVGVAFGQDTDQGSGGDQGVRRVYTTEQTDRDDQSQLRD